MVIKSAGINPEDNAVSSLLRQQVERHNQQRYDNILDTYSHKVRSALLVVINDTNLLTVALMVSINKLRSWRVEHHIC